MAFRYDFIKRNRNSISNIPNLLDALGIEEVQFEQFKNLNDLDKYKPSSVPKSDGKSRTVYNPAQLIRLFQRRINTRIFHPKHSQGGLISWPSYLFGSIPNNPQSPENSNKNYITCAGMHCGAKSILKMDISDFFDNIHHREVINIFEGLLKFPNDVSQTLADICCYKGNVIQGALTSSYIASAVLFDVEPNVVRRMHEKHLVYTRLVDDITISSKIYDYDFSYAKNIVIDMLRKKGLPTNEDKTIVINSSTKEGLVHGLRVCFKEPRLPADEVGKIRASVQHVERFARDAEFRTSREYRRIYNRCLGRVNRLKQLGHNQYQNLKDRLIKIEPKPCKADIKKARSLVRKVKTLHKDYGSGYRYRRLYYKAQYELNILQRTFSVTADSLRKQLRRVKPTYEQ
uniref:RNA-directed DNA polymerase (Reverse transcriptase) n=1 Tax=Shewanella sp. (strain MR-7) TaxID=60481 RepID=Q0HZF0_SHESR